MIRIYSRTAEACLHQSFSPLPCGLDDFAVSIPNDKPASAADEVGIVCHLSLPSEPSARFMTALFDPNLRSNVERHIGPMKMRSDAVEQLIKDNEIYVVNPKFGYEKGTLSLPFASAYVDLADGKKGIAVAGKNNLVQVFDLESRFYRRITSRWLTRVADITSDDTYVYIADFSGRIIPFKHDLKEMAWTVKVPGKIDSLAVCDDYLYAFDPDSQTIHILDKRTGKPVQLIGPNPKEEGNRTILAVLDDHIITLQKHSSESFGITGMAVDMSEGHLFLSSGDMVYVFDANNYLGRFAVPECSASTGRVILGLDIDWQSGNLLVSHGLLGKASGITIFSGKARQVLIGDVHHR